MDGPDILCVSELLATAMPTCIGTGKLLDRRYSISVKGRATKIFGIVAHPEVPASVVAI